MTRRRRDETTPSDAAIGLDGGGGKENPFSERWRPSIREWMVIGANSRMMPEEEEEGERISGAEILRNGARRAAGVREMEERTALDLPDLTTNNVDGCKFVPRQNRRPSSLIKSHLVNWPGEISHLFACCPTEQKAQKRGEKSWSGGFPLSCQRENNNTKDGCELGLIAADS